MDIETKPTETFDASLPMHNLQESYLLNMRNEIPFGVPSSQGLFLQDFHYIDQFHGNGYSSSNQVQIPKFDPFDNFTIVNSSIGFNVYDCKPFVENSASGFSCVMDNFLYGGGYSLNLPQRNQLDLMVIANQRFLPFNNPEETNPLNFVVPDEVSSISPLNYYKKIGANKSNKAHATTERTCKVRKRSKIVKGQWTREEDRLLIQLVEQYGLRKWSHIAQLLLGRIGKQCRERWYNHLRPDIKKDIWNDEEDKILIEAHAEIGNKWAEIAKRLPGRTENSIKNHWNATKRRQYSKRKCRSKYPRGTLLQEYIKSLNLDKNPPIDYRRRSSKHKTSTSKILLPTKPQIANEIFPSDWLVSNYDFNEVPDFCFGENLFEEGCSIDSLLDNIPCGTTMVDKDFEGKIQYASILEGKECDQGGIMHMQGATIINLDDNHVETEMQLEIIGPFLGVEVKKELDLVEMMSQANEIVDK